MYLSSNCDSFEQVILFYFVRLYFVSIISFPFLLPSSPLPTSELSSPFLHPIVFNIFSELCSHHNLATYHHPQRKLCTLQLLLPNLPIFLSSRPPLIYFVFIDLFIPDISFKWIHIICIFCVCLLPLSLILGHMSVFCSLL